MLGSEVFFYAGRSWSAACCVARLGVYAAGRWGNQVGRRDWAFTQSGAPAPASNARSAGDFFADIVNSPDDDQPNLTLLESSSLIYLLSTCRQV